MEKITEYAAIKFTPEQVTAALDFIQENRDLPLNEKLVIQRAVDLIEQSHQCMLSSLRYDGNLFFEPASAD